jgi:hypothetical protein
VGRLGRLGRLVDRDSVKSLNTQVHKSKPAVSEDWLQWMRKFKDYREGADHRYIDATDAKGPLLTLSRLYF